MDEKTFRNNLKELLTGGSAHITLDDALRGIDPRVRNKRPSPNLHTVFEELEHIRIAQEDILRYTLNKNWGSPDWPSGFWPGENIEVTEELWNSTIDQIKNDLDEVVQLVENTDIDLTDKIPHGEGRTYLREILLVADHNAYHLGKIVDIRKALGDW